MRLGAGARGLLLAQAFDPLARLVFVKHAAALTAAAEANNETTSKQSGKKQAPPDGFWQPQWVMITRAATGQRGKDWPGSSGEATGLVEPALDISDHAVENQCLPLHHPEMQNTAHHQPISPRLIRLLPGCRASLQWSAAAQQSATMQTGHKRGNGSASHTSSTHCTTTHWTAEVARTLWRHSESTS